MVTRTLSQLERALGRSRRAFIRANPFLPFWVGVIWSCGCIAWGDSYREMFHAPVLCALHQPENIVPLDAAPAELLDALYLSS